MEDERNLEIETDLLNKINIESSPMDDEEKRQDKAAYINGKRTSNLMFGYNKSGVELTDDTYFSVDEIIEAVNKELSKLAENEIVAYKRTGKKATDAQIISEILKEAKKDSMLNISSGTDKISAKNYTVDVKGKDQTDFKKKGNFIVSKDIDLRMGEYITKSAVEKALDKFTVKKLDVADDNLEAQIKDMLDKYYGNPEKEKEYKKRLKRFKSHIITKDGYKTVESYPEKKEDEKFLQLDEYQYKLECLSKAENGDNSEYEYLVDLYNEMGAFSALPSKEDGSEYTREELIEYLKIIDSMYIKTNNSAYNQHINTQENLKTLGKFGEQQKYLKLKRVKDDEGKIQLKIVAGNIGKSLWNTWLFGRNAISANIHKAIGKFIVAPIHKLIFDGEKISSGLYKNLRTHRYEARKDYFEQQLLLEESLKEKKTNKFIFLLKYLFGTRLSAIFKAKEGNIAVLSAGAHDIQDSINSRKVLKIQKLHLDYELNVEKQNILKAIANLEKNILEEKNVEQKEAMEIKLDVLKMKLLEIEEKLARPLPGIIQTDAISLDQHDRANKENVTKVVSGIKRVGSAVAVKYIAENLTKFILKKIKKSKYVKGHYETYKETVSGEIDKETLENMTMKELVENTKSTKVDYHAGGGRSVTRPDDGFIRGVAIERDGNVLSSSDGIGFDVTGRTTSTLPVSEDTKVFDLLAETMSKSTGKQVTSDELIDQILSSPNPQSELESMLNTVDVWTSGSKSGMPTGWLDIDGKSVTEFLLSDKVIDKTRFIPGYYTDVISYEMRKVIDKRMAAALALIGGDSVGDLYELSRRTKTKEEMKKEGTLQSEVLPFQKSTKAPYTERNTSNDWNFTGDKAGDYASLYEESDLDDADLDDEGKSKGR